MLPAEEMQRARKAHRALRGHMLCDFIRCFAKNDIQGSYEYVKRHRRLHGQHSLGENAPLDPPTALGNALVLSGNTPPPNTPAPMSQSRQYRVPSSPFTTVDNFYQTPSQSPGGLSNTGLTPNPNSPRCLSNLTPEFSPRYLVSRRNPRIAFIPSPSPIPPGRDITLDLPPWRQDPRLDLDAWMWDLDIYPPTAPRASVEFLGEEEERIYWASLLDDEELPPAPGLDHDPEADDEDWGDPDDAYYGIEPEEGEPDPNPESDPEPELEDEPVPDLEPQHEEMEIYIGHEDDPDEPEEEEAAPAFHRSPDLRNFFIRT
ncbi:hypothetical protein RhiJN_27693 [Ceratobasidium sp. AG-Ba]|nr:hypothetical protein RhiJN_13662 [Ceratobasidium sp. AG-Ba]QRV99674.1 hypothetical protein RhiJN_27693 [Ceratobasidium sp. AG-Ba]QRW14215.1 hypothetical protein RhiLY_13214 [Ceratobasidium sp. AG-Ba]